MDGLGLGPMPGQRPIKKTGLKRVPATQEEINAFDAVCEAFAARFNGYTRGGVLTQPITRHPYSSIAGEVAAAKC